MKLTTASEYALIALLYMSRKQEQDYIPLSRITDNQELPFKYMEHLMHKLCRAGIVTSLKGQHGGYKLSRPSNRITVAEIVRLLDGPLAPVESVSKYFYKPTIIEKEKKLSRLMGQIRDYTAGKLENTTLKDLV